MEFFDLAHYLNRLPDIYFHITLFQFSVFETYKPYDQSLKLHSFIIFILKPPYSKLANYKCFIPLFGINPILLFNNTNYKIFNHEIIVMLMYV